MNAAEYDKMFALEDTYWWFVARRNLAIGLLDQFSGCGVGGSGRGSRVAGRGDERSEETGREPAQREHFRPLTRVLDVGCGTGAVAEELAKRHGVVGLDMSSQALSYISQRGITNLVHGDGTRLPFASGSFQAIVGLDIFEHIEDDRAAFAEAHRVLSPGGTLVLSVPAFMALWSPHDVALHHFRRYRKRELVGKLREAGFEIVRCSYSVFLLFPLVVLSRILEKFRHGEARASLPSVPGWMNSALIGLMRFESKLLSVVDLPWGSSLVVVARKGGVSSVAAESA